MSMNRINALLTAPSSQSWKAICALLDDWTDESTFEATVAAVDAGMQGWPEKGMSMLSGWPIPNRIAPKSWAGKMKKGAAPPAWSLVRFLQYHDTRLTQADLKAIIGSGQLTRITHLYFGMTSLQPPLLGMLADAADQLPALEAISLYGNSLSGDRMADFLSRLGGQLTYLNFGACKLNNDDISSIAEADNLSKLEGLVLSACRFDADGLDLLMQTAKLPSLTLLKLAESGFGANRSTFDHQGRAQQQGPRHLRRAAWAGTLTGERPAQLKQRCRDAGVRGYSRGGKDDLIALLLGHWDETHPA